MNPDYSGALREDLPDGSTLLFDSVSLMTYPISSSASLVWRACDGLHGIDEIVDQMESHYEVDRETADKDVSKLLHDFAELGPCKTHLRPPEPKARPPVPRPSVGQYGEHGEQAQRSNGGPVRKRRDKPAGSRG